MNKLKRLLNTSLLSNRYKQHIIKKNNTDAILEKGDGENSIVQEKSNAVAFGVNSTAFGTSSTNAKDRGITEESTSSAIIEEWRNSDPADNKFALAFGEASHVEGNNCLALGKNSHAEGNGTIAGDNSAHSEGTGTQALGKYSHAEGLETNAIGERSHAEGQESVARGKNSHAEGQGTEAAGKNSHAEGRRDKIVVPETIIEDRLRSAASEKTMYESLTYSAAKTVYSIGDRLWKISTDGVSWEDVYDKNITVSALWDNSPWVTLSKKLNIGNKPASRYVKFLHKWSEEYPEDRGSVGVCSHTEGINTYAQNEGEHAEGKYNKSNNNTIHSIGIGTSYEDKKNAFEVLDNGLIFIYGVNGYDGTNIDASSTGNSLQAGLKDAGVTIDDSLFGW